jgi:UDP-N-acetyl-D-galactosamine dehydrogenase
MGIFVSNKVLKLMIDKGIQIKGAKALILGVTFKENCPDVRNSKVIDIFNELTQFGLEVEVYDPFADSKEVEIKYGIKLVTFLDKYDAIILAVSHNQFIQIDIKELKKNPNSIVFDIKGVLDRQFVDSRL